MAEGGLVEQLNRDLLECGICMDRYTKPKGLPCLHCFCHDCLQRYCEGRKQFPCPNCKQLVRVPKEGVSGFPAHFIINSLQEALDKVSYRSKQFKSAFKLERQWKHFVPFSQDQDGIL